MFNNRRSDRQLHLALTLGDPAGIGPEIALKALANPDLNKKLTGSNVKVTIIGDRHQLESHFAVLNKLSCEPLADPEIITILDLATNLEVEIGQGSKSSGAASFKYLDTAIAQTLAGKFSGIVTAPIAKSYWQMAGHSYPGQTELLAERSNTQKFGMMFVAKSPHTDWVLKTLLATVHIPLAAVTQTLTPELITWKLDLLRRSLKTDFGIDRPRLAVAGINPHSGEDGNLGHEEKDWLRDLLSNYQQKYPEVELSAPIPPDTMWVNPGKAWHDSAKTHLGYDAYLAMYHDQGLIPVKLLGFEQAVNTTIGLPFVRTSPDHGTAFDIAGKGIASADSLIAAIELAAALVVRRHETQKV
ncbi:4-hydroxythreonine-4-phosphate dehydrogenase [Thalassoporum mexicanum PCC 7367]|uniref:4-hydroxythreonine-4-phosphate dehydrogenase PdxA n=1 Tax=Thalassoporum mexicanum TaxID=3457544 RepID=UPI00029FE8EE|nr:4-hydroxythreonine-4-phosphate dehydrogenase PdxA [Pseudanabaena sp. PCC 7367]AFY71882.1 4-hydroxythreonine-4-phosphate dehydrogenase [Pseudanabaena sp. PCC 7367]